MTIVLTFIGLLSIAALALSASNIMAVRQINSKLHNYRDAINAMYDELDDLHSTHGTGNTKLPKLEVNGNRVLVPSDGLPLTGHTIIVGQTGSGKSNVAMSQIIHRINAGHEVYIVDTKNELGPLFRSHVKLAVEADKADELFDRMIELAAARQALFAEVMETQKKPCLNYGDYFKRTGNNLPVVSVFVEELVALMADVEQKKLIKLLVLGRSAGVFVVALAQYLRSDILDRAGSVNFSTRVFLGRYDQNAFGILFGQMGKEDKQWAQDYVGSPGKGIIEEEGRLTQRTFPQITDGMLESWMK